MHLALRRTSALGLAALGLAGIVALLVSGASAQDPATSTLTFKTLDKGSTFEHIRNTKAGRRANSTGDVIVFTNPLADSSRNIAGTLYAACTTTKGARNYLRSTTTCTGVIDLRNGTLTLQANSKPGVPTTHGAITGGTGPYANTRGVFIADDRSGDLTITLAD